MPKSNLPAKDRFRKLIDDISILYIRARNAQVQFAWETGRRIVQEEQYGAVRAEYGANLLPELAKMLTKKYGSGFSDTNLRRMRRFYLLHPKQAISSELDWSDFVELIPIKDERTRKNLEQRVLKENLNSFQLRELVRRARGSEKPNKREETIPVKQALLTPKRGTLYTYRIVRRPQLGAGSQPSDLLLDLGFGMYKHLTSRVAGKFSAEQIVESDYDDKEESYSLKASERTAKDLFTYQAIIEKVIDADTLKVRIDLGFDLEHRETLRLRDINAPELGTKAGDAAKAFVQSLLKEADIITLHTTRSDKYDRYLADVFLDNDVYLNNLLLEKGYAQRI